MGKIKLLDKNLINQIAAGEVIERPASVVKELVENSIDAGATRIAVDISNDSRDIRVADNGSGISKDDIKNAFTRHATSKILTQDDLWNISTLGFRGEALASIISIAKVTCITKTKDDTNGVKAVCAESEIVTSETGCDFGTTMEINDLFYNVPARAKFLKNSKTEIGYIQEIMQGLAISHPEIVFSLTNNGSTLLKTTGSNNIEVVISEIYNSALIKELKEVNNEDLQANVRITGIASTPLYTRSNRKGIYIFVNGRSVKCPICLKAIDNAYSNLIPKGKYPFIALSINLKPEDVDVNVHPTKREVRYKETNLVYNFIYYSIKNALSEFKTQEQQQYSYPAMPEVSFNKVENDFSSENKTSANNFSGNTNTNYQKTDFSKFASNPRSNSFKDYKSDKVYIEKNYSKEDFSAVQQHFLQPETAEITLNKPNIIGQFKNTYILIEREEGLELIDQHIAHERYLYETLKENLKNNGEIASQMFFTSLETPLAPEDIEKLEKNKEILAKQGYAFEIKDNNVIIKEVPVVVAQNHAENIIEDVIECLNTNFDKVEDAVLIMSSCKGAVKAGQKLSMWQMNDIIEKWMTTKNPQTCPHGRPISKIIETKEIAKCFLRNQ
ncbi:MAG: DNA mismatch repair endonuclease MutL [Candidatus Gastranaerophilales bacterium]|nr:DNA mismatch repair endonuclease MutL [Candidatus Gastranaerophilales bacterium]